MSVVGGSLVLLGSGLTLLAAVGVARLPDVYARLHALAKATSLGMAFLMTGVAVLIPDMEVALKALLAVVFQFFTAPVAAHVLGRAAHRSGVSFRAAIDDLAEDDAKRGG